MRTSWANTAGDVEDTVQCLVRLESGAHGMICSSWADRPRRDDVPTLRIDGTAGVAIAGGHRCFTQATAETPRASWDPDRDLAVDYPAQWSAVPDAPDHLNPYRRGWEGFLRHLAEDTPFDATLRAGVRDVLFAEAVRTSVASGTWVTFEGPR